MNTLAPVTLVLAVACTGPTPAADPVPVGSLLEPMPLDEPIDVVQGTHPWQNLGGTSLVGHVVSTERESFVFGSRVITWREHDDSFYPTPGEVIIVSADRERITLTVDDLGWGTLEPLRSDVNGDGLTDLLVTGDEHVSYLPSPFDEGAAPTWRERRVDIPIDNPLRSGPAYWPGATFRRNADITAMVDGILAGANLSPVESIPIEWSHPPMDIFHPTTVGNDTWMAIRQFGPDRRRLLTVADFDTDSEDYGWDLGIEEPLYSFSGRVLHETGRPWLLVEGDLVYALDVDDPGQSLDAHPVVDPGLSHNYIVTDLDGDGADEIIVHNPMDGPALHIYRGPLVGKDPYRDADLILDSRKPELPALLGFRAADLDGDGADELALIYTLESRGVIHIHEDVMAPWHDANPGYR